MLLDLELCKRLCFLINLCLLINLSRIKPDICSLYQKLLWLKRNCFLSGATFIAEPPCMNKCTDANVNNLKCGIVCEWNEYNYSESLKLLRLGRGIQCIYHRLNALSLTRADYLFSLLLGLTLQFWTNNILSTDLEKTDCNG